MKLFNLFSSIYIVIFSFLTFCIANLNSTQHGTAGNHVFGLKPRANDAPLRAVYVVADIELHPVVVSPTTGRNLLYGNAFLYVEGTAQDGALRVEHIQPVRFSIAIRALDYGVENNGKPTLKVKENLRNSRRIYPVGQTRLTNAEFADPSTGKGLVLDVWSKNPEWTTGSNCCNQFVQNLVKGMNLETPRDFNKYVTNAAEFARNSLPTMYRSNLPLYLEKYNGWGSTLTKDNIQFDTTNIQNPKLVQPEAKVDDSGYLADTADPANNVLQKPLSPPQYSSLEPPKPFTDVQVIEDSSNAAATGGQDAAPQSEGSKGAGSISGTEVSDSSDNFVAANNDLYRSITSVRVNGVVSDLTVVLQTTAKAAGIAGLALAPVFIILDFAHGNPIGGAFGAVGLFLGLLATAAIEGPIGWLVGGLAAFFAILPSFFTHPTSEPPHTNNATEIIQYAMFGDFHHTGNEKCQEQNPNCTAVYGPSVISLSFQWDNFDPIAFLLQYNQGYAMTIPEIASAFYVVDPSKPNDGADKIATITCKPPTRGCGRFSCPPVDKTLCASAKFALNRSLITIPVLNQTADKIYDRIIPNPHGDCKLVNDISGQSYADYNLTVTGSPVAIACGITPSLNVSGVATLINDTKANNSLPASIHSFGNQSTDGNVHDVAAPSPRGFPPNPLDSTNSICLGGTGGNMCFPNGTYDIQNGVFGFDSGKVTNLSLANGASLSFTVPNKGKPREPTTLHQWIYTTNQPTSNRDFYINFDAIVATALGPRNFNAVMPPGNDGPPVACLFSQPQYHGDMICYGVGSGNVSANVANVPQSLALHGNASVWIYGNYYGDDGGQQVTESTPDLSTVPFGADDNFNQKIKALWVTAG